MADPSRLKIAATATEKQLLEFVREAAAWGKWLCYHTHRSDKSERGFPDLVLVHSDLGRVIFAELKNARGKVEPNQAEWLQALQEVRSMNHTAYQDVGIIPDLPEVYLWRPADQDQILQVLMGHLPIHVQ